MAPAKHKSYCGTSCPWHCPSFSAIVEETGGNFVNSVLREAQRTHGMLQQDSNFRGLNAINLPSFLASLLASFLPRTKITVILKHNRLME
jgi:hypothetical protein